jgi:hypothetical protein
VSPALRAAECAGRSAPAGVATWYRRRTKLKGNPRAWLELSLDTPEYLWLYYAISKTKGSALRARAWSAALPGQTGQSR